VGGAWSISSVIAFSGVCLLSVSTKEPEASSLPRAPSLALGLWRGDIEGVIPENAMPSLFRFLFVCAMIAGTIYGTMVALVTFVEPTEREVTIRIPSERVNPQP
jgi:hypothetical protein